MKKKIRKRFIASILMPALLGGALHLPVYTLPAMAEEVGTEQEDQATVDTIGSPNENGEERLEEEAVSQKPSPGQTEKEEPEGGEEEQGIEPTKEATSEEPSQEQTEAKAGSQEQTEAKADSQEPEEENSHQTEEEGSSQPTQEEGELIPMGEGLWIAGFVREGDTLIYTGERITQELRIYHKDTLLQPRKDYVVTYKNNLNAAPYNSINAPSVTIAMKGQYTGSKTLYFTILPRNIDENQTQGYEQVVYYSKNLDIPAPIVYFNGQRLEENKDFVCDYSSLPPNPWDGDTYQEGSVYEYTVNGIGNFAGSFKMSLSVLGNKQLDFGNAVITLNKKEYEYHGKPLSQEDVRLVSVRVGERLLSPELYEYQVHADGVGIGYLNVYPSETGKQEGYRGEKELKFKVIADRDLREVRMGEGWQDSLVFSQEKLNEAGGIYQEKTGLLVYGEGESPEPLTEGIDYRVQYYNAKNAGKAIVIFTGIGRYEGSLQKKYTILPNTNLQISFKSRNAEGIPTATYRKGGAIPEFEVTEMSEMKEGHVLTPKKDYITKVKNNRKLGTMTCEIIGRGNYWGYYSSTEAEVILADISQATITTAARPYSAAEDAWKASVIITDVDGMRLRAGTDYDRELAYSYAGMEEGLLPQPGDLIQVTATGMNGYEGSSITGSYYVYSINLKDLIVEIDPQQYTGKEIRLSKEDIHLYASAEDAREGREIEASCYEIVGYSNNTHVGTAKVILRGIGYYGGVQAYSFSITKKEYVPNRVSEIVLDESELFLEIGNSRQLTASIYPQEAENKTVIWTSSNNQVATVSTDGTVTAKQEGAAAIYATSQDTGMKAECLVFVNNPNEVGIEGNYVTPIMFKADDAVDDTRAFNDAISSLNENCNILYVPAGTYRIDAETKINLRSNMSLILADNAVIQAIGNSSKGYDIIYANQVSNVTISGGHIMGERYSHGETKGEWGMGIGIYDSTNIQISNIAVSDCWGDGIYLGTHSSGAAAGCRQVTITGCRLYNNRRNNLSIVSADYVTVDGCQFNDANGTAPEYGIDIETNDEGNPCEYITISNSTFEGNAQGSMGIITAANGITIRNCRMDGDFINYAGRNVTITDSVINGEVNARMGITLTANSRINDGSDEEDILIASFSANQGPYTVGAYNINSSNVMENAVVEDSSSPSGKALRLKRLSRGTQDAGYYLNLSELTENGASLLEAGSTYRFEYVVKGNGTWGIKTDQTGWYPCVPSADTFATGMVTYRAGSANSCRLLLYAVDRSDGMELEIDSIKIYKVR